VGAFEAVGQVVGDLHEPSLVLDATRAVPQVHFEPRGAGPLESSIQAVGDQPLGALAPAAARQGEERAPERLAPAGEGICEPRMIQLELARRIRPRPTRQRHDRQRARSLLVESR
jgi:hypothetical protein